MLKVEFSDDHFYEQEEEYATNLFAGLLLMPEKSFRRMYLKLNSESGGDETMMDASRRDDYFHIEKIVVQLGEVYVVEEYINERTLKKAMYNMRELYRKIKGV